ncbi:MAG: arginine--tRNA ligase [Candidatus Hadarchaeota archaeon]
MMFREFRKDVINSLKDLDLDLDDRFIKESEHAELACTIAFKLAKEQKRSPAEVAEDLISQIEPGGYVGNVEALNGYINFYVDFEFLEDTITIILDMDEDYGFLDLGGSVLIEHTSSNPDGPLHIGHLRNSIIGDTLTRIFQKAGIDVTTHFYVNDMGRQIALAVLGAQKLGIDSGKKPDHAVSQAYIDINRYMEEHPEEKEELDQKIDQLMVDYEAGDKDVVPLFEKTVNTALEGVEETLKKLNITHDQYVKESQFVRNSYVDKVLKILEDRGILQKDGAWYIDLSDYGHEKELYVKRKSGTTLYVTRDLAYHLWKNENFERSINVLGSDHKLVGKQLSDVLRIMGLTPPEIVFFEFVSLPEGSMSTRKGKFVSADELVDKVLEESYKIIEDRELSYQEKDKISRGVAAGAIRYDFVRIAPEKTMTFDWRKALDFERQTASYIQYSHTRACSILRKAVDSGVPDLEFKGELTTPLERKLVILLSKFSTVVEKVVEDLRPSVFADYIMEVAITFTDYYNKHPVLKEEESIRMHRLAVVDATRIVLRNGLELLGIEPLEKM